MNNNIITRSNERTLDQTDMFLRSQEKLAFDLRVSCPAVIQSVNFEKQTLTAKLAIREQFLNSETKQYEFVEVPELLDVPFFILSGGDYSITFPIKKDDECLVIFGDNCIDAWWQNGDIQNPMRRRRHSLSDSFALVGFRSQPNVLQDYSPDSLQIRNKDGSVVVELKDSDISLSSESGDITIDAENINMSAENFSLNATSKIEMAVGNQKINITSSGVNISGGQTQIDGKNFLQHAHSNGNNGSPTGGVI